MAETSQNDEGITRAPSFGQKSYTPTTRKWWCRKSLKEKLSIDQRVILSDHDVFLIYIALVLSLAHSQACAHARSLSLSRSFSASLWCFFFPLLSLFHSFSTSRSLSLSLCVFFCFSQSPFHRSCRFCCDVPCRSLEFQFLRRIFSVSLSSYLSYLLSLAPALALLVTLALTLFLSLSHSALSLRASARTHSRSQIPIVKFDARSGKIREGKEDRALLKLARKKIHRYVTEMAVSYVCVCEREILPEYPTLHGVDP